MAAEVSPFDSTDAEGGAERHIGLAFFIEGTPVPKARPRLGKGGRIYTPQKSRDWEDLVALQAKMKVKSSPFRDEFPLSGPVRLVLRFEMPRPKSLPKRVTKHVKKPDVDNLGKSLVDGLVKGGVLKDDNLVFDLVLQKHYAERGTGCHVGLTAWTPE